LTVAVKKRLTLEDLFGAGTTGNLLRGEYHRHDVYRWFQKQHAKANKLIEDDGWYARNGHEWEVPWGVRQSLTQRLTHAQIAAKYPFYVTWISPKTGKRLKKFMMSLPHAIVFVAEKAQYADPEACIVVRHGFYIPRRLMGKFPRRMRDGHLYYWCPCCMQPRRFKRTGDVIWAPRKEWNEKKHRYEFTDRKLAELRCPFCGITNKFHMFRASNQPVEVRRLKPTARRVRKRRR